jgi:hypothetical protein
MQARPRTITHGDARGYNLFMPRPVSGGACAKAAEIKGDGKIRCGNASSFGIGIIDWQMWVAGPCANEFPHVWMNSFSEESGMVQDQFEALTKYYHDELCRLLSQLWSIPCLN